MTSTISNAVGTETILHAQSNQEQIRFFALGIYVILMILDMWIIISLIHFGIKTKKFRRLQHGNPDSLSSGRIYLSVVVCSIATFLFHLVVAMKDNIKLQTNEFCDLMTDMIQIMWTMCAFSIVLFLWFRQRGLYTAFLPMAHISKSLNVFSFIIIFVTFFSGVIGLILLIVPNDNVASPIGCVKKKEKNLFPLIIAVSTMIFSQVSLLFVFVQAMLKWHGSSLKARWKLLLFCKRKTAIERSHVREQPVDRTRTIVHNVIRKTTIFAALSLLFDLVVVSLTLLFSKGDQERYFVSVLGAFSTSMNLCFVILSFTTWKEMITSPCKTSRHEPQSRNTSQTEV